MDISSWIVQGVKYKFKNQHTMRCYGVYRAHQRGGLFKV